MQLIPIGGEFEFFGSYTRLVRYARESTSLLCPILEYAQCRLVLNDDGLPHYHALMCAPCRFGRSQMSASGCYSTDAAGAYSAHLMAHMAISGSITSFVCCWNVDVKQLFYAEFVHQCVVII